MEAFIKGVALDTNVLVSLYLYKKNGVAQLRETLGAKAKIVIPSQVANELAALSGQSKKMAKTVAFARQIMKRFKVTQKKVMAQNADEALEKLAAQNWVVVTNDRVLRQKISGHAGTTLGLSRGRVLFSF